MKLQTDHFFRGLDQKHWLGFGLIVFLIFIPYSNIFQNEFVLDDFDYIVNWPLIQDWRNFPQFFIGYTPPSGQGGIFSPFKTLFHAVNYHLFGLQPFGYHVVGLLIYFISLYYVYRLSLYFLKKDNLAFLSTLLFGLHPLHVEYVASMTGNVDNIGILFMFIAFEYFIRAQKDGMGFEKKLYNLAILFAFLAMFTHELVLSTPLLFLWYNCTLLRSQLTFRQSFQRTMPFFFIAAIYALLKFLTLGSISRGQYLYDSFYLTMFVMIKSLVKYVYMCFFPKTLTINHVISPGIYSYNQEDFDKFAVLSQSIFEPQVLISLLVLSAIGYLAYQSRDKNPLITFCIGWFFFSLLPASGIVPNSVLFAERYIYPATLTFCILLAFYWGKIFSQERRILNVRWRTIGWIFVGIICFMFMMRIWLRNKDGRDEIALFESALKVNPHSSTMWTDLGLIFIKRGNHDRAMESFSKALQIRPDNQETYFAMSEVFIQKKDYKQAIKVLNEAIKLNPQYADAFYNLAGIYAYLGFKKEAREKLDLAVQYYREQGKAEVAEAYQQSLLDYFDGLKEE